MPERIAVGLAIDVEQDRRLAVCGNDPVDGFYSGNDLGDISDANGDARWCGLYNHCTDLGGRAYLSAN